MHDSRISIMGGDDIHIMLQNQDGKQVAMLTAECETWPNGTPNMVDDAKLFATAPVLLREVQNLLDGMSGMDLRTIPLNVQRNMITVRKLIERQKLPLEEFHRLTHE